MLIRGCSHTEEQISRYEDSIKRRDFLIDSVKKEGQKVKISADSIFTKSLSDSVKSRRKDDSLLSVIGVLKGKYSTARDSTITLWKQLKTFYLSGDTSSLKAAYYELRAQLDSVNNLVDSIQLGHDSEEAVLRGEADSAHIVIRSLHDQMNTLKSLLDKQTQIAEAGNREEVKILAIQKRKKILGVLKDIGIALTSIFVGKKL